MVLGMLLLPLFFQSALAQDPQFTFVLNAAGGEGEIALVEFEERTLCGSARTVMTGIEWAGIAGRNEGRFPDSAGNTGTVDGMYVWSSTGNETQAAGLGLTRKSGMVMRGLPGGLFEAGTHVVFVGIQPRRGDATEHEITMTMRCDKPPATMQRITASFTYFDERDLRDGYSIQTQDYPLGVPAIRAATNMTHALTFAPGTQGVVNFAEYWSGLDPDAPHAGWTALGLHNGTHYREERVDFMDAPRAIRMSEHVRGPATITASYEAVNLDAKLEGWSFAWPDGALAS